MLPELTTLQKANLANLQWLETYAVGKPELTINGVEILRCFTYELIQVFNNVYLREQVNGITESQ